MTRYQRYVCVQALIVVSGWFSLRYGWGLDVQSWLVLMGYGVLLSTMLYIGHAWVVRGRESFTTRTRRRRVDRAAPTP